MSEAPTVLGVDGWKDGWVAVALRSGSVLDVVAARTITEVLDLARDPAVVGIDIPIGFVDDGLRASDVAARDFLGSRRSTVFVLPPRRVMEAPSYTEARRLAEQTWVQGVSAQAYALRAKILEVDAFEPEGFDLIEVHPEVSFQAMNGGPLLWGKRTWNGQNERRALLESAGLSLPSELDGLAARVPADDVLDAGAVAWTAERYRLGRAVPLPPELPPGDQSIIWY